MYKWVGKDRFREEEEGGEERSWLRWREDSGWTERSSGRFSVFWSFASCNCCCSACGLEECRGVGLGYVARGNANTASQEALRSTCHVLCFLLGFFVLFFEVQVFGLSLSECPFESLELLMTLLTNFVGEFYFQLATARVKSLLLHSRQQSDWLRLWCSHQICLLGFVFLSFKKTLFIVSYGSFLYLWPHFRTSLVTGMEVQSRPKPTW